MVTTAPPAPDEDLQRDAGDLRRSLRITLWSYLLRVATPLLQILVIRMYGAGSYGVYAVVLAILTFIMRVALLGLDKGLLWWLPQQDRGHERAGLRAALVTTTLTTAAAAALVALALAPWLSRWADKPEAVATLRWMAIGMVPMGLMEIFIHANAARRRPESQIVIKDGLVPVLTFAVAAALHLVGVDERGLAVAHTVAVTAGMLATAWLFGRAYRGTRWRAADLRLPAPLLRAARPLWLTDLLATAHGRIDMYMLAALSDPVTTGLYQGALQIANNLLAVRTSFDSLVTVLVAEVHGRAQVDRIVHGFSHALGLVALIVAPLAACIAAFTPWILPLLGAGFERAVPAVWVLSAFFVVHGTLGMNQQILVGSGRGAWVLADAAISLTVGAAAFALLLPPLGLLGAALANGLTYFTLSLLLVVQVRVVVGRWPYDRGAARLLGLTLLAALAMAGLWWGLAGPLGQLARVAGFLGFVAVFAPGAWRLRRRAAVAPAPAAVP